MTYAQKCGFEKFFKLKYLKEYKSRDKSVMFIGVCVSVLLL